MGRALASAEHRVRPDAEGRRPRASAGAQGRPPLERCPASSARIRHDRSQASQECVRTGSDPGVTVLG